MTKDAGAQERSLLYEQELELINRQTEQREAYDKQICRIRHDMKNHMTGLLGILQTGSREETEEYIRFLMKEGVESQVQEISHSGNSVVDAIVNDKYRLAQKEGVKFAAAAYEGQLETQYLDGSFCSVVVMYGNKEKNYQEKK